MVKLTLLTDELTYRYPQASVWIRRGGGDVERPLFWTDGERVAENRVYLASEQSAATDLPQSDAWQHSLLVCVKCAPRNAEEVCPNLCILPESVSILPLMNLLQRVFDRFDAWSAKLQALAAEQVDADALLDCATEMLQNPVLLIDEGAHILARSQNGWSDSKNEGEHPSEAFCQALRGRMRFSDHAPVGAMRRFSLGAALGEAMTTDVGGGKQPLFLVALDSERRFYAGDETILSHLGSLLTLLLSSSRGERFLDVGSAEYDAVRKQIGLLLDDGAYTNETEAAFVAFGWRRSDPFVCMELRGIGADRRKNALEAICAALADLFRGSASTVREQNVICAVNLARCGKTEGEVVSAMGSLCAQRRFCAGVSDVFAGLDELRIARMQAALALGEGERGATRYSDAAVPALCRVLQNAYPTNALTERATREMCAYDAAKGTEYLATLRAYYEHGMNAMQTADALFIHRSTLLHRFARMRELFSLDPDDVSGLTHRLLSIALLNRND